MFMQQWLENFIKRVRTWPWWSVILAVWLLLGPGYVLLYNTMWGVLGSQRAVYVTFGPMALAIGLLTAILLYQYFRDRD